jgi:hypothetical protein
MNKDLKKAIKISHTLFARGTLREGPASELAGGVGTVVAGVEVLLDASPSRVMALIN